ncbi:ankyrin repeat-containing domain protein [Aspergillus pseudoustus]|uniref:Ankyrin repeat-containing domain protein n=1 Tax=Aspergillus pseudoustus TaxID=1810923 RepID=A0ABR4JCK5_9EURO
MDFNIRLPGDPLERRRQQNRIAQRKFRQKKQLAVSDNNVNDSNSATLFSDRSFGDVVTDIDVINTLLFDGDSSNSFSASLFSPPYPTASPTSANTSVTPNERTISSRARKTSVAFSQSSGMTNHQVALRELSSLSARAAEQPDNETGPDSASSAKKAKGWLRAIHIAAQKGHERIMRVLLQRSGVDPNAPDSDGRTPLFHAVVEDHEDAVRLLLSHGARIGVLDCEGRSVLHWAVLYQRLEVLRTLLDHWSEHERDWFDIDAYDMVGWTPLHLAVERGFEPVVLLLLQQGADINAKAKRCPYTGGVIPFNVAPLQSSKVDHQMNLCTAE